MILPVHMDQISQSILECPRKFEHLDTKISSGSWNIEAYQYTNTTQKNTMMPPLYSAERGSNSKEEKNAHTPSSAHMNSGLMHAFRERHRKMHHTQQANLIHQQHTRKNNIPSLTSPNSPQPSPKSPPSSPQAPEPQSNCPSQSHP